MNTKRKRKTPRELTREHITKKDHVITDEDFKNVKLDNKPEEEPLDIPDDKNRPKDEDKDPKIVTPWDVIS